MAVTLRLIVLCSALSQLTVTASAAPLSPTAGDTVVEQSAVVAAELQRALADDESPQVAALRSFVDSSAGIRVYQRDGQLLFAISTTRTLNAVDKRNGERTAASLARQVLQREFAALDADTGFRDLDVRAVRVVLVEPEALSPSFGSWSPRSGGLAGTMGGVGACGSRGGRFIGDGATPIPFAPAGHWAGGSATPAPCVGCR